MTAGPDGLVAVNIVGLPLDVVERASEHSDELLREFALIHGSGAEDVPARLLTLINEISARFGAFTQGPTSAIQDALARGATSVDVLYQVPPELSEAAIRLGLLLDEADDFCRAGDLLTLATLPESVLFRRWFLDEFVSQIAGAAPRPWSSVMERTADG